MLSKLTIKFFQSHQNVTFDFCPGVNCIIGLSQSGKTAVVRAIQLLRKNRPRGFRFNSHFADGKPTYVKITTEEKTSVMFKKKGGKASYTIDDGVEKKTLSTVNVDVPEQVNEILRIEDINISDQMDTPYLITSSPGEITRTINKLINLEKTDKWVKKITSRISSFKNTIKVLKRDIKNLKSRKEELKDVPEASSLIEKASKAQNKIDSDLSKIAELESIRQSSREFEDLDSKMNEFTKVIGLLSKIESIESNMSNLYLSLGAIDRFKQIGGSPQDVNVLDSATEKLNEADEISAEVNELERLEKVLKNYKDDEEAITNLKERKAKYVEEYVNFVKKSGKCPICFSEIDDEVVENIREEL